MKQGPRLEFRQGQSLVMTQQLQQSIKLLQCNSLELREFVEAELEKNPFLQQEEGDGEREEPAGETPREEAAPREADRQMQDSFSSEIESDGEWDDAREIESDYLRAPAGASGHGSGFSDGDDERDIEDNPSGGKTLREHLLEQLNLDIADGVQRLIGAHLIDLVDEAGYIKESLQPLAQTLGVEANDIETVLGLLQRFDPPGICARNLSECLAQQLREKNRLDPAMQTLLAHLDLLGAGKFDDLQKKCGVDKDDLRQMIAEIRALNPKPGLGFSHDVTQAVEPDMFVRRLPDGNWHVELNMNNFPKVMVNRRYYKKVTGETRNNDDKKYLSDQLNAASWLVRALEQRAETMLKVSCELVKQQDAFFRLGVRYLKPMTLKDIAGETGYHESTISRVTNGKFLVCPRGTFELKYFFTSALARASGGEDVSSAAVKFHIRELIEKETPEYILSDDELVELLKERNVTVARRTVAKYREAIGIPSSPKRRRLKAHAL